MSTIFRSAVLAAMSLGFAAAPAVAQEASILSESTVIGQNFGYPTGTPGQDTGETGTTDFVAELAVFFKNHELLNLGDIEGETFFGVLAPVRFRHYASETVTVELGAVLGQNFGDEDSLDEINALIRVAFEPADNMHIIGGTLIPTHWTHDALYDDVQKFRDLTEQGLQWRVDRENWKQDTWINWRIREGEIDAEEFEVGNATQLRFFEDRFRLDGQLHWAHAGGQISLSPRVENNLAVMAGMSWGFAQDLDIDLIEDLRIGASAFYSSDDTKQTDQVNGDAWEVSAVMDLRPSEGTLVRIDASYFNGSDYLARRGDPLYTLEDYAQLGATGIWSLGENGRIEAGAVWQGTEDHSNYTAQVNLIWGTAFIADAIVRR